MYKNWMAICRISDTHVMWAFALLDMNTELGQQFAERFPEYFTMEEQTGPYPLSLMRAKAAENGREQGSSHGEEFIQTYDGVPHWIPLIGFDIYGNNAAGLNGPKLPKSIDPESPQGALVTWEGKRFVVIENNESCEEMWLAPAELVAMDR